MPRSSAIRKPISNSMVDREFDPDKSVWFYDYEEEELDEWLDEDQAALKTLAEWEETS